MQIANKNHRRMFIISISCFFLVFAFGFSEVMSAEMSDLERVDEIHQEIIDLVLQSSSYLQSQADLISQYESIEFPEGKNTSLDLNTDLEAGTDDNNNLVAVPRVGFSLSYPLSDPEGQINRIQREISLLRENINSVQKLDQMKKEMITEITSQIKDVINLVNQTRGQKKLAVKLKERSRELKDLIEAEIVQPEKLWELDERINDIKTEIANLEAGQILLVNEIANNYAASKREEIKEKLNLIIKYIEDGDRDNYE